MARYQLQCLVIAAVFVVTPCYGEDFDTLKAQESSLPELAKEVEDNSRYKTLEANATVLKLLVDDKNGVSKVGHILCKLFETEVNNKTDDVPSYGTYVKVSRLNLFINNRTEVFDMLHSRDENEKHMDLPTFPEDGEDARVEVPMVPDSQAEFLQAPGDVVNKDSQKLRYSGARGEPIGAAAGIMVAITCTIVCLAYTALIVWRRIYLKRNGLKHELLRNEENIAETRIEL